MKASVEVIYYKVRPLKNGEYPLMLRITKSRKRKVHLYRNLGKRKNFGISTRTSPNGIA
ncbi:MAG: Arm DNA-binding domain-containing protein [Alistipes indistinctus]